MKVLSLIQPWATFIILGASNYETRTWRTRYRGPLAIHASQKTDKTACREEPHRSTMKRLGYTAATLPTGVILGTCRLVNCVQIVDNTETWAVLENGQLVTGDDYLYGGYDVGYYAWELTDRKVFAAPIPAKGKLGLWEYPIDESSGHG